MKTTKRLAFVVITILSLVVHPLLNISLSTPAYADSTPGASSPSSLQPTKTNVASIVAATPLAIVEPTPQINDGYFNTYAAEYKGMKVGFSVHDFGVINAITIDVYQNDRKIVTNTGTQALYAAIDAGQTQIVSPFYTQGTMIDANWNTEGYNWGFADHPTGAVVTVTGASGTKMITITPLSEVNGVTFKSLVLDTTAPSVPAGGAPDGLTVTTSNVDFMWQVSSDDSGDSPTYTLQYSQDATFANATMAQTSASTLHTNGLADGIWYWRVNARDTIGNTSPWSPVYMVTVDTKGPALTTDLSENESLSAVRTIRTTTDAASWHLDVYATSDLDHSLLSSTKNETEIDTTKLANGKYVAIWTAQDIAGNTSSLRVSFQVDNIFVINETTTTADALPTVALAPLFFTPDTTRSTAVEPLGYKLAAGNVNDTKMSTPGISAPQVADMARDASSNMGGLQASQSGWRLFGVNWYWWLLGMGAVGIIVRQVLLKQK